ncbi:hypothetical protein, partial [Vibrio campbellii]|uniref:hypothetical protein n=1 Tax=Vibrio campbellii TaxID=680 RepID=UPI001BD93D41
LRWGVHTIERVGELFRFHLQMDESRFTSKRSSSRISKDEVRSRNEAFSNQKSRKTQKSRNISVAAFLKVVGEVGIRLDWHSRPRPSGSK